MVITLKDGSVITLFEAIEAREIIGEELYDFLSEKLSKSDEKDEKIYELENEIDDLEFENNMLQNAIDEVRYEAKDALDELKEIRKESELESILKGLDRLEMSLKEIEDATS